MKQKSLVSFFAVLIFAASASAQGPSCTEDPYRDFDFWIGEWDVFPINQKGEISAQKAGVNVISTAEYGCLIVEQWTNVQGVTGQSYNYFDPGLQKWRQIWVSNTITIDYAGGLNDKGEMVLEGDIAYRNGSTFPFKGIWRLNDDNTVRQHFEQYNPKTQSWDYWFTGHYVRRDDAVKSD